MTNKEKLVEIISSLKDEGLKEITYSRNVGEKSFCEILADRLIAAGVIIPEPLKFPTWEEAKEKLQIPRQFKLTYKDQWNLFLTDDRKISADFGFYGKTFACTSEGYAAACAWIEEQWLADLRKLAGEEQE